MRLGITLIFLGSSLIVIGLRFGELCLLLCWIGLNFGLVGCAHCANNHQVFGKQPDGTIPIWSRVFFLPLNIYTTTVWMMIRLISSEPSSNQVTERIHVGRRLLASELETGFCNIVDLTAEFEEPKAIRESEGYRCFPILDGAAPKLDDLQEVIRKLPQGKTYIHCAQGHGRTGLFAIALMLTWQEGASLDECRAMLQTARPGVRLNDAQERFLSGMVDQMIS